MQVQSPTHHSGLRIGHCHSWGLDLIPGQGTPYAVGQPKKKKKNYVSEKVYISFTVKSCIDFLLAHFKSQR